MKKKYFISILLIVCILSISAQQKYLDKQFYYYKCEKIYLPIDHSRISVISEGFLLKEDVREIINGIDCNIKNETISYTQQHVVPFDKNTNENQNKEIVITEIEFITILDSTDYIEVHQYFSNIYNVIKTAPIFDISDQNLGVSNNFYVKLFKEEDVHILLNLAKKYSIEILGYNEFMPLWITLSCVKETPLSAIEAANLFYESQLFECAEPELLYNNLLTSDDQYFCDQWGLKNTGQYCDTSGIDIRAESAWNITTGSSNIRIAVFDQGIKMDHPDLINNIYSTGYDAETNTTPSILRNNHGTPCAGIIAAQQNNTIGISGVAPNSQLIPISINLYRNNTPQQFANGFNWAWRNGADIISNSWGLIPQYWNYPIPSEILENAIDSALIYGRDGKGTIVVFSSGNENNTAIRYPGSHNPDILVVGAISPDGARKSGEPGNERTTSCDGENWGSCYGLKLDIMAPGVFIPTTTYTGGFTLAFNGTSAACPHVSGVAALVLSVNPELTGQQVRNIIESTAQKVGGYNYQPTVGRSNGTWHQEMGYGLVDAYAAVLAARCYNGLPIVHGTITQNTTWNSDVHAIGTITIPNYVTLSITSTVKCDHEASILIHPGGKLILDGGTLTNACPDQMWQGVTVMGDPNLPASTLFQGYVHQGKKIFFHPSV